MVLAHNKDAKERTRDIEISVDVTFDSMLLSNKTLEGLKNSGFFKPSPIQLHGIPLGKCGFDLILEAKSGTGKTAVFTVITLEQLDLNKGLQSVILAPTREIAYQVRDVIKQIGSSYTGLNVEVVIGGLSVGEDIEKFKKNVHILVGSPGRMRHLIQDKHIDVSAVRLLVLDEADKLIDKSFQADINYIFSALPKQKQVILSSATYPDITIMQNYVKKAQHICPDSTSILLGIKQFVTIVDSNVNIVRQTKNKFEELLKILTKHEFKQCLIFCNYQVRVGELCKMLKREKWPAEQLHGQLEQMDRLEALKTLQGYKCRILVSTDLAARGIDASNVDLVINFEAPYEWQTYLHRIGRAGRFGSFGIATTILSKGSEHLKFKEMMKSIGTSINMHYLWDDNTLFEFDTTNSNNDPIQKPIDQLEVSKVKEICGITKIEDKYESADVNEVFNVKVVGDLQPIENGNVSSPELPTKLSQNERILLFDEETNKTPVKLDEKSEWEEKCTRSIVADESETLQQERYNALNNFNVSPTIGTNSMTPEIFEEDFTDEDLSKCDQLNENEDFEKFNKVYDSSNKPKCKIESFDELITSFNEYEPNNNDIIEIPDNFLSNNIASMLNDEIEINIVLDSHSDTDFEEENNVSSHNYESKKNSKKSCDKVTKCNSSIKNSILQDKLELRSTIDTTHKALIDAGLPTSFGSTKYKNKNLINEEKSLKCSANTKNTRPSDNCSAKELKNRKVLPIKNKIRENIVKSSTEPSTSIDDGYNTHSGLLSRSTKSQNEKVPINCNKNDVINRHSRISVSSGKSRSNTYSNYDAWYKQLKTYMQQVEMSLYIDELSKV